MKLYFKILRQFRVDGIDDVGSFVEKLGVRKVLLGFGIDESKLDLDQMLDLLEDRGLWEIELVASNHAYDGAQVFRHDVQLIVDRSQWRQCKAEFTKIVTAAEQRAAGAKAKPKKASVQHGQGDTGNEGLVRPGRDRCGPHAPNGADHGGPHR